MEVELLNIILLTIARVATTNCHITQITRNLEGIAIVNHGEVELALIVEIDTVWLGIILTVSHTLGLGGINVDGALSLSSLAQSWPILPTIRVRGVVRSRSGDRSRGRRIHCCLRNNS